MKIALPLILLLLVAVLVATAAEAPAHYTAGPGTPPSTMSLVAQVRAYELENDTLRAENAALKAEIASLRPMLENLIQLQSRNSGLRVPSTNPPLGKSP